MLCSLHWRPDSRAVTKALEILQTCTFFFGSLASMPKSEVVCSRGCGTEEEELFHCKSHQSDLPLAQVSLGPHFLDSNSRWITRDREGLTIVGTDPLFLMNADLLQNFIGKPPEFSHSCFSCSPATTLSKIPFATAKSRVKK